MMDWLARLVDRRPWRVVILAAAIFAAAGVLGAGVGDRLDPYGADDPGTESVIADKRLALERGHLWGRRDVTIPIGAVSRVNTDSVTLRLTKDGVAALPAIPVHRWADWPRRARPPANR